MNFERWNSFSVAEIFLLLLTTVFTASAHVPRAILEKTPRLYELRVQAVHPSGLYTAYATNSFTNSSAGETISDTIELYTPTIALVVPMNFERWNSFSVANTSSSEAKLTYVRLNTQTPCPPRGAVPVHQGCCRRLFHSQHPDRLRSWMRLPQLCRADGIS